MLSPCTLRTLLLQAKKISASPLATFKPSLMPFLHHSHQPLRNCVIGTLVKLLNGNNEWMLIWTLALNLERSSAKFKGFNKAAQILQKLEQLQQQQDRFKGLWEPTLVCRTSIIEATSFQPCLRTTNRVHGKAMDQFSSAWSFQPTQSITRMRKSLVMSKNSLSSGQTLPLLRCGMKQETMNFESSRSQHSNTNKVQTLAKKSEY